VVFKPDPGGLGFPGGGPDCFSLRHSIFPAAVTRRETEKASARQGGGGAYFHDLGGSLLDRDAVILQGRAADPMAVVEFGGADWNRRNLGGRIHLAIEGQAASAVE